MLKQVQKGFTLIELMIVVAIIGILAAIAIPAYQDYTIRAQVTEGATLADGVKVAMQDYYAQHGTWPTTLTGTDAAAGLNFTGAVTGQYVASVATAANTGEIIVTFGNRANAKLTVAANNTFVIYAATSVNQDIIWICGQQALPAGATTVGGAAAMTTVVAKYLPRNCQA
jgi:type IV pilus assembly protein PilA